MDAANKKEKANELLANWSKWLITINMFAATGCIVGLKTAGEATGRVGVFFFGAICSFCLSIVCSTLLVFFIATQQPASADSSGVKFIWLAKLQWMLFTLGLVFVLIWIAFMSKIL